MLTLIILLVQFQDSKQVNGVPPIFNGNLTPRVTTTPASSFVRSYQGHGGTSTSIQHPVSGKPNIQLGSNRYGIGGNAGLQPEFLSSRAINPLLSHNLGFSNVHPTITPAAAVLAATNLARNNALSLPPPGTGFSNPSLALRNPYINHGVLRPDIWQLGLPNLGLNHHRLLQPHHNPHSGILYPSSHNPGLFGGGYGTPFRRNIPQFGNHILNKNNLHDNLEGSHKEHRTTVKVTKEAKIEKKGSEDNIGKVHREKKHSARHPNTRDHSKRDNHHHPHHDEHSIPPIYRQSPRDHHSITSRDHRSPSHDAYPPHSPRDRHYHFYRDRPPHSPNDLHFHSASPHKSRDHRSRSPHDVHYPHSARDRHPNSPNDLHSRFPYDHKSRDYPISSHYDRPPPHDHHPPYPPHSHPPPYTPHDPPPHYDIPPLTPPHHHGRLPQKIPHHLPISPEDLNFIEMNEDAPFQAPSCSKDKKLLWCLEDDRYPRKQIEHAAHIHAQGLMDLYADISDLDTELSVKGKKYLNEETYLCSSETSYIRPLRAKNTQGRWRVIVNNVRVHYQKLSQSARIEHCLKDGEPCPLVPHCYSSTCLQKYIYHRFLVFDPYDHNFPFAVENFRLPSSCACKLDEYKFEKDYYK